MAKVLSKGKGKPQQEEAQKKRKKQAKKEAKFMLLVEKAKKGVRKAEQKVTKAQTNLQASKAQLQELEEKLSQLHHTDQESSIVPVEVEPAEQLHTDEEVQEPTVGEELHTSSPVEETEDSTSETSATTPATVDPALSEEELTISSGEGSMPIITHDENAWPPPLIREEIAQSATEAAAQEPSSPSNENHPASDKSEVEEILKTSHTKRAQINRSANPAQEAQSGLAYQQYR